MRFNAMSPFYRDSFCQLPCETVTVEKKILCPYAI
uniref:Uncharacterized protein n=1 Tax=Anguilla anguilla TaxID=7936 RepID=A0A0E9SDX3_ANGAN